MVLHRTAASCLVCLPALKLAGAGADRLHPLIYTVCDVVIWYSVEVG
jgi:hypothetical protein